MDINSSIYDDTHTWQNANDRVAYQRAFQQGSQQERRCAMALLTANPLTPDNEIREILTIHGTPPREGYEKHDAPTIDDVLMTPPVDPGTYPTDFSGSNGEYSGSSVPTLEWF